MITGLTIIGKFNGSSAEKYKNAKGEDKISYVNFIQIDGGTYAVKSSKELNLVKGQRYIIPVGINTFVYTDKKDQKQKAGVSYFAKTNEVIENVI